MNNMIREGKGEGGTGKFKVVKGDGNLKNFENHCCNPTENYLLEWLVLQIRNMATNQYCQIILLWRLKKIDLAMNCLFLIKQVMVE